MTKRIISFLVSVIIVISSFTALASVKYTEGFAEGLIKGLEIMVGDANGNMNLENLLTRAEFAKIAVNTSQYKNMVAHGAKISVFGDCTYTHWAAPYVKVAATKKIVTGYPDGSFRPDNTVSLEEAVTVMLRLIGYTDEDFGNTWPYGQMSIGKSSGLTDGIARTIGEALTRGDALRLVYNTLNAGKKDGKQYCTDLGAELYDNVIMIASNTEDTSVSPGHVLTSSGTFRYEGTDISDFIGLKGSLAVKNGGGIICFSPYDNTVKEYVVYSVLSDSLVVYKDGGLEELKLSSNTPVYSGAEKLTFSGARTLVKTGDVIYAVCDYKGAIEHLTLTRDSMDGPHTLYVYSQDWYKKFTTDYSSLTVVRNGEKVPTSSVKTHDILYYSKELNTVFAYSKTVTGIYENALPNKDTPSSVIISGTEYEIESVDAFSKLSSAGNLSYGTTVTLLLGRDSKIADVITSDMSSSSESIIGYLIETGKKSYSENGESYTSRYIKLILTDGKETEYKTKRDYSSLVNSIVRVSFEDADAVAVKASALSLTGTVNATLMTIGSTKVSDDIEIIDVSTTRNDYKGTAAKTYMQRIDGITLSSSSVLWYSKDSGGNINKLILNDVTGDTALYGIVTDAPTSSGASASYTIDSGGQQLRYSGGRFSNISYVSPVKLVVSGGEVQTMSALTRLSGNVSSVAEGSITIGSTNYKLSDRVEVYRKLALRNYAVMTLSELTDTYEDYKITAYCDKTEKSGGRVRILIAE